MSYQVAISRCRNYEPGTVRSGLASCLALLGGIGRFVKPGQRVLVKPNLLARRPPHAAVTTHPAVVQAVVEAVQEAGAEACIGDSPGYQNTG
ncbi:MAG: DUF362 domain-containing protein, partial [Methanomicrobiales archaeon]|nr:DUF362 domain-containing protein [Methanomicrobiales archaeon]